MTQPSVQLYSVRDAVDADIDAAIDRVSQIGYTQVEPYAFHKRVADYRRAFAASGVTAPSGHAAVIDSVRARGGLRRRCRARASAFVIDPFIPTERWQPADDVKSPRGPRQRPGRAGTRAGTALRLPQPPVGVRQPDRRAVRPSSCSRSASTPASRSRSTPSGRPSAAPTHRPCCARSASACKRCTSRTDRSPATSPRCCPAARTHSSSRSDSRPRYENQTPAGQGDVDVIVDPRAPHRMPCAWWSSTRTRATSSRASPSRSPGWPRTTHRRRCEHRASQASASSGRGTSRPST